MYCANQKAYSEYAKEEDINFQYNITEETIYVKITPKINIKNFKYTLHFKVPFSKILNNPEGYDFTKTIDLAEANKPITHSFKTENIEEHLKGYPVDSIQINIKAGNVQNQYKIRPYERGYKAKDIETMEAVAMAFLITVIIGILGFFIWVNIKQQQLDKEEEYDRKCKEEEARRRAEAEAKRKAEAEYKAIEEARKRAEAEAKRKAEEESRKRAEAEAKRKAEEERKRAEKEAEEERKRKSKCFICGECSMGNAYCDNCFERAEVFKEEFPKSVFKNYGTITHFHQTLINNAIDAKTFEERKYHCTRLLATTLILSNKYFEDKAINKTFKFTVDLSQETYPVSNELRKQYYKNQTYLFKDNTQNKAKEILNTENINQHENTDFRQRYKAPYRCNDGHYVRSKAEREIDNFFYEHHIWHEYEKEYICHNGKKYYPDFFLSDYNLIIEYFGRTEEEYIEKKEEKIESYRAEPSLKFAYLDYTDDANLTDKLTEICRQFNIPLK